MSNLRLSYLQKVRGIFVQAIPPTQKSGGDVSPPGFTPVAYTHSLYLKNMQIIQTEIDLKTILV